VLARLREEIGPFLGMAEEEGFRSPGRQGSRSPTKSPVKSPGRGSVGGKSPYRRNVARPVN